MGDFFAELAKKLAERWVSLLLLPGVLFLATAALGVRLGHAHALDVDLAAREVSAFSEWFARRPAGAQVGLLVAVLVATGGVGLLVQAMAGVTRTLWLGQWPRPFGGLRSSLVRRRRVRWHALLDRRRALTRAHPAETRTAEQQEQIDQAAARVNRVALAEPGRPTWLGDRIHGAEAVARDRYGLDLPFVWPRLWLVLPEAARADLMNANTALATAVAIGSWSWPLVALAVMWWPAALVAAAVGAAGWVRARGAVTELALLVESVVDLHGRTLAVALGVADDGHAGPLTVEEGSRVTAVARKGR
ncbi:hypothetical protein IL992_38865 [Microbispora sp. NEAU-D428]|uniref:hypothetical protein n=1 Tax=Microbispora sitophila TaxID=2771537 RepID=UPI001865CDC9|nr:hypothetical protein [Microbispora sitophila]MBE3015087.1 hypothetical protein [Microbispora sitophila]